APAKPPSRRAHRNPSSLSRVSVHVWSCVMRPYWKGYLKLALVSCPIALYTACSTSERITFRQINKVTGNRLRQQLIDEETGKPIAPEQKGRGYQIANGRYLMVDDAEIVEIAMVRHYVVELVRFVPRT